MTSARGRAMQSVKFKEYKADREKGRHSLAAAGR
jgi:hypothetical protein